jgi:hypothetical protein
MDIAAPDDRLAPSPSSSARIGRILLELLGTVVVLGAIGTLFFNWLGVYLVFFGETPEVTRESVITYQAAVGAGILGTLLAVVGSAWRNDGRPGRTVWWHAFATVVGLAAALVFHVGFDSPEPTPERPTGPVCYSGSNDCVGG